MLLRGDLARSARPLIFPLAALAGPSFSRKGRRVGRKDIRMTLKAISA